MSKTVRLILIFVLFFSLSIQASAQNRWELSQNGIELCNFVPHSDHLEMSGEQMSVVLRWSIDNNQSFHCERSLVFPMLRTVPNNTHASLRHRTSLDIISLVSVNGQTLQNEAIRRVWIDGYMGVSGDFSIGRSFNPDGSVNRTVNVCRTFFPSTTKPLMGEIYNVTNISKTPIVLYVPEFSQRVTTLPEKGVTGSYYIETALQGEGTYILEPGESRSFSVSFQARRPYENAVFADLDSEFDNRCNLIAQFDDNLILQTPDPVLDAEFRFAKIRAAESIFKTAGGYLHSPGGEAYYAAIWANDQAEYVNPLFPFLGYGIGNAAALNSYLHFKRFINPDFNPLPSSIIAEGIDIWDGAGDRGDAAMIAYGASRYLLARADKQESEQLWPLVEWCLEYCNRKLNDSGVVASDSDELEGRFPSGDANLCTSCLYYDALLSASMLCKQLGFSYSKSNRYENQARALEKNIENYFGADIQGYHSYRYYDGNTVLRSWICMPLIVGLKQRAQETISALTSDKLMTDDGLLTEQGSTTFWDRSTLYALRGIYACGDTRTANDFMHHYCERRLLGAHVPYPIEAWPEGSQRHLSAESGLFCRAITEGMFSIRPESFNSFRMTPQMPEQWEQMSLNHIRAFGGDFDICVSRKGRGMQVKIYDHKTNKTNTYNAPEGKTILIKL